MFLFFYQNLLVFVLPGTLLIKTFYFLVNINDFTVSLHAIVANKNAALETLWILRVSHMLFGSQVLSHYFTL